jgi:DNA-binding MarR family transcriptional regulator
MERKIGTVVAHVGRLMRRNFDQRAREIGITRPQWQVLTVLRRQEGIKQGGLADILEVEPITAGRMIDRMQDAGLVERKADPADRRAWRLYLTERGQEMVEQLRPLAQETSDIALEGISDAEKVMLYEALEKMRLNLTRKPAATGRKKG